MSIDAVLLNRLRLQAEADGIQQLVVGAVVRHNGRVLLLRRPQDDFMGGINELPSGKVEPGEDLDAALAREVKEETGLDIDDIWAYLGHFDYLSGSGRRSRQFNFDVRVVRTSPVVLQEHDSYQWFEQGGALPVTPAVGEVLRDLTH